MNEATAVLSPRQWQFATEVAQLGVVDSLVVMPGTRLWCWHTEPWKLLPRSYRQPPLLEVAKRSIMQAALRIAVVKIIRGREHLGCVVLDDVTPAIRAALDALGVPAFDWSAIENGSISARDVLEKAREFIRLGKTPSFQPHPEEEDLRNELDNSFMLTWPWHLQGIPLGSEIEQLIDEYIAARRRELVVLRGVALRYLIPDTVATTAEEAKFRLMSDVDFLVHGRSHGVNRPLLAIEYDGRIHEDPQKRKRDEIKDRLCAIAELPILRISTSVASVRTLKAVGTDPYERLDVPISRILAIAERLCEIKVKRIKRNAVLAKRQAAAVAGVRRTMNSSAPADPKRMLRSFSGAMEEARIDALEGEIEEQYLETLDSQLPLEGVPTYQVGEVCFKLRGAAEYAEVLLQIEGQRPIQLTTHPPLSISISSGEATEAKRILRAELVSVLAERIRAVLGQSN